MSYATLRANLIEMAHANDLRRDLVPSGNRVYHKGFSQGQLICFGKGGRDLSPQLEIALEKIKELFWGVIVALDEQKANYFTHLASQLNKKPYHPDQMEASCQKVLQFCLFFKPFIRAVLKGETAPYIEFLGQGHEEDFVKLKSTLEAARFCQRMANVETVTGKKLPLRVLLKVASDKDLSVSRKKIYEGWIERLSASVGKKIPSFQSNRENRFVQVRSLHRLFVQLVQFMQENVKGHEPDVGRLEASLCQHDYEMLECPDAKHLAWRNGLNSGDILTLGRYHYTLGELLENPEDEETRAFAVVDDPSIQVEIYKSEAWHHLKEYEESILHCGLTRAKVFVTEKNGALVIRERLYRPLAEIAWTSMRELTDEDEVAAEPIVELIRGLAAMENTPYPLEPENFLFNSDGEMRSKVCLVPQPHSFENIEFFAYHCAFDPDDHFHLPVFLHLMQASNLSETQDATEYHDVVRKTLEEKKSIITISSRNTNITDKYIQQLRKQVYLTIREVRHKCIEDLVEQHGLANNAQLKQWVHRAILTTHKKYCPGRIFERDFYNRCLQKALQLALGN